VLPVPPRRRMRCSWSKWTTDAGFARVQEMSSRLRIVHIITRLILGGAQENTLLSVEGLQRRGDRVTLITGPAMGPEGSLMDRARHNCADLRVLEALRRPLHPWHDAVAYRSLLHLLRELKPDVVHTHSAKAGLLGRRAAWKAGVPIVVHTIHGSFHAYRNRWLNRLYTCAERWAARHTTAFISVANAMTEQAIAAGLGPPAKFTTIYSGMEVDRFLKAPAQRSVVRASLGYADEDVVVGKVARLFDLKGHEYVIEAAREVVAQHPQARFLFVGDGILRDRLQHRIRRAGLTDRFHFTGLVPPEEIPGLLAAMDIVVHCSLREGLARVLPQALIVGRPVVCFDVDGANEVVLPGRTGFLVPARAVAPLANALCRLIVDPDLRARYAREGRALCTDRFRDERMTDEIRALYQRCLSSALPGAATDKGLIEQAADRS
jgi:glycosyltransferase involved in cell wall biosynthesis